MILNIDRIACLLHSTNSHQLSVLSSYATLCCGSLGFTFNKHASHISHTALSLSSSSQNYACNVRMPIRQSVPVCVCVWVKHVHVSRCAERISCIFVCFLELCRCAYNVCTDWLLVDFFQYPMRWCMLFAVNAFQFAIISSPKYFIGIFCLL